MKNITLFENFIKTNEGFATTAGKKFNAYFNELGYENFDEFIVMLGKLDLRAFEGGNMTHGI